MQGQNNINDNEEKQKVSLLVNPPSHKSTLITLNIGLYPWAANEHLEQYCRVIEHYWYNVLDNKHVHLNWLTESEWDGGYRKIPQDHFDVYIYDTLYTNYFASQGWLSVLNRTEITYANEIHPNILSFMKCDDETYYGIPIYGCFYLLFYRSNDKELGSIKTFEDLVKIASKRHFIMRKPDGEIKASSYVTLLGSNQPINHITEENINTNIINHLSRFYQYSKLFLDQTDRYSFEHTSFYIGYAEDINTMLLVDENDLSQIELMLVPFNNQQQSQCWLDGIAIHPQTKRRQTYETSLQLANLMTCSNVTNDCLNGQFYLITTNHITLSHLSLKNSIYAKLQALIESNLFRPSSLPLIIDSSLSVQEQQAQAIALIIAQHQKQMQSIATTITTTKTTTTTTTATTS